jgi:hypothetical protein
LKKTTLVGGPRALNPKNPGIYPEKSKEITKMLHIKKLLLPALLLTAIGTTHANERHFTYTTESAVLAPGAREFELWATHRTGRHDFYSRFDYRAEWEFGLKDRLMTAFYLNWHDIAKADSTSPTGISKEFEFDGISTEWKYKMSDPSADKIGSAVYGEFSIGSTEMELESKIILDKRFGDNLIAYNLVGEVEWEREPGELEYEEAAIENNLAFTHFINPRLGTGLELRNHTEFTNQNHPEHSALFLGPVVSYATEEWWVAFSALAQLPAIKRSVNDKSSGLILDEHERYNLRVLLSFHL